MDQDTLNTIFELAKSVESRFVGLSDTLLKEEIKQSYRVDLDEDDEDKIDNLMELLVRRKKTANKSTPLGTKVEVRSTPTAASIAVDERNLKLALTHFAVGDHIRHNNCPDWGEGDVVYVEPFQVGPNHYQRLTVLFNRVGRKILVVMREDWLVKV